MRKESFVSKNKHDFKGMEEGKRREEKKKKKKIPGPLVWFPLSVKKVSLWIAAEICSRLPHKLSKKRVANFSP